MFAPARDAQYRMIEVEHASKPCVQTKTRLPTFIDRLANPRAVASVALSGERLLPEVRRSFTPIE
jgi:hypothetical protein